MRLFITVDGMAGGVRFTGTDTIRVIDEGKSKGKNAGTPLTADALNNAETTAVYYFHCDHLGTPQAITDKNGNVVWKADYKPFGEVTLTTAAVENNFRFPGQYFDEETGLHYNWHRYYNAGTGRYVTSDPIGLEGGVSLYGYVLNNPINFTDPPGLIPSAPLSNSTCWTTGEKAHPQQNTTVCDGAGGIKIQLGLPEDFKYKDCVRLHENVHKTFIDATCPDVCKGKSAGIIIHQYPSIVRKCGCEAYQVSLECFKSR